MHVMATAEHYLDRYLDPLTEAMSAEVARRIVDLKPDPVVVAHIEELGQRSTSGTLTPAERDEYQALADAGTLIALLKAKARRVLSKASG